MGVKVRQKGGKWYVFINHQGQRKAKCIGSDKCIAVQVQKQLENPASRLGKYLPEKRFDSDKVLDPFTSAELERYLTTMQTHYPQYYVYFLRLARTGIREGEGPALHWDELQCGHDASDPHRFVHMQRTYDPVHHLFNTPKSGYSRRVDMSKELRTAFLDLKNQRFDAAILQGRTTIPSVVFCTDAGRPWDSKRIYLLHKRVCTMAGSRVTRVHDLRHSYATIQRYELHAPIQYISEQLGHASIKIPIDIYGHPRQGTNTYLADRLDRGGELTQHSATQVQSIGNMVA